MENIRGRRGIGEKNTSRQLIYEDFEPFSDWTQDSNCHVLLIDLPGFKKEEVKMQVHNSGKVTVSGERPMTYSKYSRFKKEFMVPENSDIDKISGKFEGGLLFVIIPRKAIEIDEEPMKENASAKKFEEENKPGKSNTEENPKKAIEREEEPKKENGNASNVKEDNKQGKSTIEENLKKAIEKEEEPKKEKQSASNVKEDNKQGKSTIEENSKKAIEKEEEPKKEKGSTSNVEEDDKQKISNKEENPKKENIKHDHGHGLAIHHERKGKSGRYSVKQEWNRVKGMITEKEGLEVGMMENVIEKISKNKKVIITAVLAFSVGFYVSYKLRPTGQ